MATSACCDEPHVRCGAVEREEPRLVLVRAHTKKQRYCRVSNGVHVGEEHLAACTLADFSFHILTLLYSWDEIASTNLLSMLGHAVPCHLPHGHQRRFCFSPKACGRITGFQPRQMTKGWHSPENGAHLTEASRHGARARREAGRDGGGLVSFARRRRLGARGRARLLQREPDPGGRGFTVA